MRVALYIRVSTEDQAKEGFSIDAQKMRLTQFVESQGWTIYDFFIDDGYSAKNLDRPHMQRMIQDIKQKKFDVVLVYRLDRMVRSVMDLHELLIMFDENDVKFKSATEVFDTTSAIGRLFITIVAAMAQWERENLAERVKMGMDTKALKGERNGAVAPYGYDLVDGELHINPMEAQVVKRIFDLYKTKGCKAIAKILNNEHVPKRDAKYWLEYTVNYIIMNPVYIGKIRFNFRKSDGKKTGKEILSDGNHEPIISEELFERAQQLRISRQKEGKRSTSDFMFTGVLRCARCGHTMYGTSRMTKSGRKLSYKCQGRFNLGVCDMPMIQEGSITESLIEYLSGINVDEETKKQISVSEETIEDNHDLIEQLNHELETIKKRKKKWQLAFANDVITLDELKEHTEEDRKQEEYILQQLEQLVPEEKENPWTQEELAQGLKELQHIFSTVHNNASKKQFLNYIFDSISINTDVTEAKGGPGYKVPVYIVDWSFKN